MNKKTDTQLLDLVSTNEAWLTYASDEAGTNRAWRCQVEPRHLPTPDIRERAERMGFGATAREAIEACFA
jgi:hypothetical protein